MGRFAVGIAQAPDIEAHCRFAPAVLALETRDRAGGFPGHFVGCAVGNQGRPVRGREDCGRAGKATLNPGSSVSGSPGRGVYVGSGSAPR